ncbi:unnamed protein product [Mortierella alpina]
MPPSHSQPRSIETLNALLAAIAADHDLTNDRLMTLMHLCGQQGELATASLMTALRLLDVPESVEKVVARGSQRMAYKVKELGSEISYTCRPAQRHCSCDKFIQVLMSDSIMCEHVLAAQLAEAMSLHKVSFVSDMEFAEQI